MFSKDEMVADLAHTDQLVSEAINKTPRLFRPPYGVTNPNLAKAIKKGGYTPIGWNVRSLDTVIKDKDKLFEKVTRKLQPGAIFLFHDTSATTMAILPGFLKYVKSNGYQVVRLDEMLNLQAYA
jgi:peptidoglycan/xylan/chitin deacetylase (PgdA/CDA1 family)